MDYTKNLKLSKPSYDDDVDIKIINTNMDMLDDNISNLDYVKNVQTDNNGLTFIKRNGDTISVSLDYMKISGGNFTGDITVKGDPLYFVVDDNIDDTNENYTLRAVKYSDGTLKNIVTIKKNIGVTTVTFLTPFKSTDNLEAYSSRFAIGTNNTGQENIFTIAHLTTTSFQTANGANASRQQTTIVGRWK